MYEKFDIKKVLISVNAAQKRAIIHKDGPLLIIAGAGTGKTTVITRRIAWLILNGYAKPEEILAVTFTNKAAAEMEERVDRLLPYGYVDLWISTFHSFCQRVLKDYGVEIGLPIDFKLFGETQQCFLVHENFKKFKLDYYKPLGNPTKFIQALVKHFSKAKDESIAPEDYYKYAEALKLNKDNTMSDGLVNLESRKVFEIANAYQTYQRLLLENNALDFGDLINYTIKLFKKRPQILQKYHQKFKYILVDEFQDTNWSQYELLKMLASPENNMTVVSDDDQSVYKFRGASYNNVLQFKKDYPKSKEITLIKNYRSKQNILNLAYNFIQLNNPARLEAQYPKIVKKLIAVRKGKGEILYIQTKFQEEEVEKVIKKIIQLRKNNHNSSWNDFAILIRANSEADIFCQGLRRANIPYQFLAASGLFSKPLILDILNYLKLLDDYHESSAVYRILNSPIFIDKIKNEDLINLIHYANKKGWSLYEAMKNSRIIPNLSPTAIEFLDKFLSLIEKHSQLAKRAPVSKVIYKFLEDSGYLKILVKHAGKDNQGLENIFLLKQFFKKVENFETTNLDKTLPNFMHLLDVMIDIGDRGSIDQNLEIGPEAVKILTVHSAKGLEFRWVFIVNLVERRFPTTERRQVIELPVKLIKEIIPEGDIHLQEERRLFYVAITRAKDGLYFTSSENYGGKTRKKISRFLYEIGLAKRPKLKTNNKKLIDKNFLANKFFQKEMRGLPKTKTSQNLYLPSEFSFTQMVAYKTCPLQYKFSFILRIPHPGKFTFSFGKSIHETLYEFLKKWKEVSQVSQKKLFKTNRPKSSLLKNRIDFEYLLKVYENSWISEWYQDKFHEEKYKKLGRKILKQFYKDFIKKSYDVRYLEMPFKIKLADSIIKGKIDRIDQLDEGLEIIDYKTGKPKLRLNASDKDQLLVYQLAVNKLLKKKIAKLTYYYLENGTKLSFLGTEKDVQLMENKIKTIIKEIKKSNFLPTPSQMCRWCDYRDICEYRRL